MAFKWTVYKENEVEQINSMFVVGECEFQIVFAEEKVSKAGNEMIKVVLDVWDSNGKKIKLYDYIVDIPTMAWKVKHFCESIAVDYEKGSFSAESIVMKGGKCVTHYRKEKMDDGSEREFVRVKDYIKNEKKDEPHTNEQKSFDDDIPF